MSKVASTGFMVLVRRRVWSGSGSPKSSGEPAAPERARIRTIAHWKSIICFILRASPWAISILKISPDLTFKHESAQVKYIWPPPLEDKAHGFSGHWETRLRSSETSSRSSRSTARLAFSPLTLLRIIQRICKVMVAEEVPGTIPLHWKPKYPLDHARCSLGARAIIFQALSDEPRLLQMSLVTEAVSDPKRL